MDSSFSHLSKVKNAAFNSQIPRALFWSISAVWGENKPLRLFISFSKAQKCMERGNSILKPSGIDHTLQFLVSMFLFPRIYL